MSCSCESESLEGLEPLAPWQRPLLTQRKGYRSDARSARLRDSIVNGRRVHPADASAWIAEDATQVLTQRGYAVDLPQSARGDDLDAWRWGDASSAFGAAGGGGTQRVGPGWSAPRFDSGEIELLIDGRRCIEIDGVWRDATTGDLCIAQER